MNFIRLVLLAILVYIIFQLIKPYLWKIDRKRDIHGKTQQDNFYIDEKDIEDADFEDINHEDKTQP
jgi:hypothetical protein